MNLDRQQQSGRTATLQEQLQYNKNLNKIVRKLATTLPQPNLLMNPTPPKK